MYYVYMLRCTDNSLYTGIASDWRRRINEHFSQDKRCAKYTKSHKAIRLEALWSAESKSDALKLEKRIKALAKSRKEKLVQTGCDSEIFDGIAFEYIKSVLPQQRENTQ